MCQETLQQSGIFGFSVCHVADARLEVLAISIDRRYHDPISEDEVQIDLSPATSIFPSPPVTLESIRTPLLPRILQLSNVMDE